ncbi:hypothetical protein K2173_002119 [Erythroxylum novogranatense]|uniref:Uncharacterized protein n=1 Tax=Erythroxylum novogranatense TaxID=1862640 RepID=A0AAV8SQE7_9ROSI|nr:hypothetical protein K2173_002119 [Erythroxylum novogranatense]
MHHKRNARRSWAKNAGTNARPAQRERKVSSMGVDHLVLNSEFEKLAQAFVGGATASSPSLPLITLVIQNYRCIRARCLEFCKDG